MKVLILRKNDSSKNKVFVNKNLLKYKIKMFQIINSLSNIF